MLPHLDAKNSLQDIYLVFLKQLKKKGFSGEIDHTYGSRLTYSTDNSVYQKLPQAIVFPKNTNDLIILGNLSAKADFKSVQFSPRGGGTGTNGQSLTQGIVVDCSRHMNKILEFNQQEGWVRVQSGVVKDQLNDFLRPYGFFFAPDLSTSNRATIGGMINTDASGQGSLVYGKTSDHVLALKSVLFNGEVLNSEPVSVEEAKRIADQQDGVISDIMNQLLTTAVEKRTQILAKFPRLNRFLTGYDLEHLISDDLTTLDISRVITGSEGSLAFVSEAKLNVTPIAKYKVLVNVKYDSFESALRHAPQMVAARATSVETVDSKVLNLAREDIIWHSVRDLIQDVPDKTLLGLNMVEYNAESEQEFSDKIDGLIAALDDDLAKGRNGVIGYQLTKDTRQINKIYAMRKKAVGLLGKTKGWAKPVAFAEDTAVPPENLADFIMEFRALLDSHQLQYGMFGHVDAGVLHVRPALDLVDPQQEALMQTLSDEVVKLVAKYGGLMWGEHGKGFRSEYGPAFFGDELFTELRKVKAAFDPLNKMNPGKICTPLGSDEPLVRVSDTKRGFYDRQIPIEVRDSFEPAMSCNGNGLCFNYDTRSPMCPSFKQSADRRFSPKGRAGLVREWLRLLNNENFDIGDAERDVLDKKVSASKNLKPANYPDDFSHQVMESMAECLACKACSSQCPVGVDVPGFRARFLSLYYRRYKRPAKDKLVANVEKLAPYSARFAPLVNKVMQWAPVRNMMEKRIGYVDAPRFSVPTLSNRLGKRFRFNLDELQRLKPEQRARHVLLVQDPFTSFYEAQLVEDALLLIERLGFNPVLLPYKPNGKPQHVKGFLAEFAQTAKSASAFLNQLADLDIPMVGLDASMVLCYRDEYRQILKDERGNFHVSLFHEWLASQPIPASKGSQVDFALFTHCTEKTALPTTATSWTTIFSKAGLQLRTVSTGCCGMAGTFGHEREHVSTSKDIYAMSWYPEISGLSPEQVLATGFSCRSQVARIEGYKPKHPLQQLLKELAE